MRGTRISLIVAVSRNGVIGRDGGLPWRLASDLKRFKAITMGKPVIMGRKTWTSLPIKPLPGRLNIVVSRQHDFRATGGEVVKGPQAAIERAHQENADELFIIGGGELYRQFLPLVDRIYLTEVDIETDGDTFFPRLREEEWREAGRETGVRSERDSAPFTFRILDRVVPPRQK